MEPTKIIISQKYIAAPSGFPTNRVLFISQLHSIHQNRIFDSPGVICEAGSGDDAIPLSPVIVDVTGKMRNLRARMLVKDD